MLQLSVVGILVIMISGLILIRAGDTGCCTRG